MPQTFGSYGHPTRGHGRRGFPSTAPGPQISRVFERILVAIDGSPSSFAAALFAASVASRRATLHLLCVTDRRSPPLASPLAREPNLELRCESTLAAAQAAIGNRAAVAELRIATGRALPAILQMEDEIRADLVCTGSGRARMGIGSVSAAVAREARSAVAILREGIVSVPRIRRIAVGVKRGPTALAAAHRAFDLALGTSASIRLCAVAPEGLSAEEHEAAQKDAEALLAELRTEAADRGLPPPEVEIRFGDPAQELLLAVEESRADLLLVGAGIRRPLRPLGRVAGRLASSCPCPLIICHA